MGYIAHFDALRRRPTRESRLQSFILPGANRKEFKSNMTWPFAVLTAEEAAEFIDHGSTIDFSGFTAAGSPKAIPRAVAAKARREHRAGTPFKVGVLTGASTGPSLDGALAEAEAISFRTPYQSSAQRQGFTPNTSSASSNN